MSAVMGWFLYCTVVASLVAAAALAGERAMRAAGRPTRWVWLWALLISLLIPLAVRALALAAPMRGSPDVAGFLALPALTVTPAATAAAPSLDRVLLVGWAVVSVALALYIGALAGRLNVARSDWRRRELGGVSVWLTRDVGPAAFGVRRASILLPEWALELDAHMQRLMLQHEREHVRAGDPGLVILGLAAVVLMPWNPALWWQLRRLRMAIEVDCDARVLAVMPDARAYGALLLEVGRRRGRAGLVVSLSEPASFLERRIRAIAGGAASVRPRSALAFTVLALLLLAAAFCARDPMAPIGNPLEGPESEPAADVANPLMREPAFTPFTVRPELLDRAAVADALARNYPPLLRDAGIAGTALVWIYIDETGTVQKVQIKDGTGYAALDVAALRVASSMRFTPARNRDAVVPVWVALPITFTSGSATDETAGAGAGAKSDRVAVRSAASGKAAAPVKAFGGTRGGDLTAGNGPVYTPYTDRPALSNLKAVSAALQANYPPLLRDAGIGGSVNVWILIDRTGSIDDARIAESSGYSALDQAALIVARTMEFTAALNHGKPVDVWVKLPISFSSR